MFSEKTVNNVKFNLVEAVKNYNEIPVDDLSLCVSSGNDKIGRVLNVSLPPIIGGCSGLCKECGCEKYCYAIRDCFLRGKTVVNARARNMSILIRNRDKFFADIDAAMSRRRKNKYMRWHVSGEIKDSDYFERMLDNARKHPDYVVWTYTKRYSIINDYCDKYGRDAIPSNMSIMFSEWDGYPMDNPYNFPVFSVVFVSKGQKMEDSPIEWTCPGKCKICLASGRGCPFGESVKCKDH